MHRSVTFSEIFSSTFSDDLNRYGDSYQRDVKAKFTAKIGIGVIEFILSSIFLCYGIVFAECVNLQICTVESGLWTTILYVSAWYVTGPWSKHICEYFENNKYNVFRYSICTATLLLFLGFFIPGQLIPYGLFGGVFSNFIYVQLKYIAIERFDMDLKTFEGNIQVARALNLLLMPHFMLLLVSYYDMYQVKVIFAAFLLNIIPAALMINPRMTTSKPVEISRYQTLPAFSNQIREMMEFSNSLHKSEPNNTPELSSSSEDDDNDDIVLPLSPKEDKIYNINVIDDEVMQPVQLTPYNVQSYYSKVGVSILPEIPEELEIEDGSDNLNTIDSRRISKISMRLEEINQLSRRLSDTVQFNEKHVDPLADMEINNQGKNMNGEILNASVLESEVNNNGADQNSSDHSTYLIQEPNETDAAVDNVNINEKVYLIQEPNETDATVDNVNINELVSNKLVEEPDRIENIEYIQNYRSNKHGFLKDFRTMKSGYCCGCSPYRKFIWRRRYRTVMDFLIDNIFKPCLVSFKDLHYYPTIASKLVTTIIAALCLTLAPYMALQKNNGFQPEDATFLLSYVAFAWCLFLVILPLVINFSKGKVRAIFVCGLILAGTCLTLVSRTMTNDVMTISCLLFGFGYGIISYTENMVYRSFVGARKWDSIQGTLDTTTSILVILTYYLINYYKLDINVLLLIGFISYYCNALLWIVVPILKDVMTFLSKYYRKRDHQQIVM